MLTDEELKYAKEFFDNLDESTEAFFAISLKDGEFNVLNCGRVDKFRNILEYILKDKS